MSASHAPSFAPGEGLEYSNTNYIVLGVISEYVGGRTLAEEIAERIMVPLGLTQTALAINAVVPEPFARGYAYASEDVKFAGATPIVGPLINLLDVTFVDPSIAWAAGGGYSTIGNLQIWLKALLDGSLISPELHKEQFDFVQADPETPGTGYGLGVSSGGGIVGHGGVIDGYGAFFGRIEQSGVLVSILTNIFPTRDGTPGASAILDTIMRGLSEIPTAAPTPTQ